MRDVTRGMLPGDVTRGMLPGGCYSMQVTLILLTSLILGFHNGSASAVTLFIIVIMTSVTVSVSMVTDDAVVAMDDALVAEAASHDHFSRERMAKLGVTKVKVPPCTTGSLCTQVKG